MSPIGNTVATSKGSSRFVLLVGRYALKFPRPYSFRHLLWGLLANMQEAEFSRLGWECLCPVYWHVPGGLLVVMGRATPLPTITTNTELEALVAQWEAQRGGCKVPVEMHLSSFGMFGDRIVAIDYGS